ncbi:uncharacterized protein BDZ99DRAFT_275634 [Mytilinidion resinicola]|uniref:Uncharacterized protein n=1 Tax=Mytilinidion resinicola TaxID=574789 RepID=A0A6A6YRM0_9PEZI|nr:uncharacterized protein BDZ99DRAFT_275634 [Mytilinidion resinicola]KAF2811450.1 hypothetical protein BDZ99DRAFT_275634 [Mytilinidion resinicola]
MASFLFSPARRLSLLQVPSSGRVPSIPGGLLHNRDVQLGTDLAADPLTIKGSLVFHPLGRTLLVESREAEIYDQPPPSGGRRSQGIASEIRPPLEHRNQDMGEIQARVYITTSAFCGCSGMAASPLASPLEGRDLGKRFGSPGQRHSPDRAAIPPWPDLITVRVYCSHIHSKP